jgi:hypothetical protein
MTAHPDRARTDDCFSLGRERKVAMEAFFSVRCSDNNPRSVLKSSEEPRTRPY